MIRTLIGLLIVVGVVVALAYKLETHVDLAPQRAAQIRPYVPEPHEGMTFTNFAWKAGGFGTVGLISGTISNNNDYPVKDIRISCSFEGKSETGLSRTDQTVYIVVAAKKQKPIKDFSVGVIHSQSAKSGCHIAGARRA